MSIPQAEFLASLRDTAYPFTVKYGDGTINKLFADMYIALPHDLISRYGGDPTTVYLQELRVQSGSVRRLKLTTGGDNPLSIINYSSSSHPDIRVETSTWGTDYQTVSFFVETGDNGINNIEEVVVKVLINRTLLDYLTSNLIVVSIELEEPPNIQISPHNIDVYTSKVNSLYLSNATNAALLTGNVQLVGGNNVQLTTNSVTRSGLTRPRTAINMIVAAGAGTGKYVPNCADSSNANDQIRTINGIAPNAFGDFQIYTDPNQPESCQWIHAENSSNSIELMNNCGQCLNCNTVTNTYMLLRDVWANALLIRNRMCQALTVYGDYVSLVNHFIDQLNTLKVNFAFEQSDWQSFDVIMRLQVGSVAIKTIDITVTYGDGVAPITTVFRQYSARRKIPGFAPNQLGPSFDGTSVEYSAGTPPTDPVLKPNKYGVWYWNMTFSRCDGTDTIPVSWAGTIDLVDASGAPAGTVSVSGSTTLTIQPHDCSI